jgi:uncharacterized protein (UPF0210 family)
VLQVKIFKALEFHFDELSREVNAWIRDNGIDAVDIRVQLSPQSTGAQTISDDDESDLLCYVTYRVEG